jgi:2-methylcitrate dehydratase PrpD
LSQLDAIWKLQWGQVPRAVQEQTKRSLKDILATAAGATRLPDAERLRALTAGQFAAGEARLWFRGTGAAFAGAAFFNAFLTDSLDWHDGFRPCKGHAGATVVAVVLAACSGRQVKGSELLMGVLLGYEIACRAGLAIHSMYSPAYHSSGSWASIGAAAAAAWVRGFDAAAVDEVMGIAEYYAPMSPMLRCTRFPASVKDGAGAGAWAAAAAVEMVDHGLSGVPSIFSAEPSAADLLNSLGKEWLIMKQYFKPYPTCRWTHPAVDAAKTLQDEHGFSADSIETVEVETFREAMTLEAFPPRDTHTAQYCMPWAVAAMLVDGSLGIEQVRPERLKDGRMLGLGERVKMRHAEDIQQRFPAECLARVTITLQDGRRLSSQTAGCRGDYTAPLSEEEMKRKFNENVGAVAGEHRCSRIAEVIAKLEVRTAADLTELL